MSSGGDKIGRPEPVSTQVAALSFSFYTADEVRSLSVKRITNPVMFDKLNNPLRDGLYDPAMGPTERKGVCGTCKQDHVFCPGHFGRVELPVPVYNPVTFGTIVRLLRCVCFHCWHFRTKTDKTALYVKKLRLLSEGRLAEALDVSIGGKAGKALAGDEDGSEDEDEEGAAEDADMEEAAGPRSAAEAPPPASGRGGAAGTTASARGGSGHPQWTSLTYGEARVLIAQYLAKQPSKCENCGCHSPALKAEGAAKILRMPLSAKARKANLGLGVDVEQEIRALPHEEDNLEIYDEVDGDAMDAQGNEREAAAKGDASESEESSSGDDETSEEEEEAAPRGGKKEPSGKAAKPAKPAKGKGKAKPAVAAAPEEGAQAKAAARLVTPTEALAYLKRLWVAEHEWATMCWAATPFPFGGPASAPVPIAPGPAETKRRTLAGVETLFIRNLLVPPNKFRPPSVMDGVTYEHAQNTLFGGIIQASLQLTEVFKGNRTLGPNQEPLTVRQRAEMGLRAWLGLQNSVNKLIDSAAGGGKGGNGIRQSLERKEGLFRMNMMGKRVNYAARSVISPDPYIMPNEVGVPPFIAKKLTITENVTPFNVAALRRAVENGPDVYPGAVAVENERGTVMLLAGMPESKRRGIAKALLAGTAGRQGIGADSGWQRATAARPPQGRTVGIKAVYRHMRDGDIMLTNRQPTLHKPGVMAHRARVLKGQRTIRLHYSNCATFNADFDGDEINLHLPQDQHGRAEAYGIVSADCQFTVPTDGKPIRGLIQDHIVSAVLLTKRDTFLDRAEFTNLLYFACLSLPGGNPRPDPDDPYEKVRVFNGGLHIEIPTPAVLKPRKLFTGKQVLTALLAAIAKGRPPINCSAKTKVPDEYFGSKSGEDVLQVVGGEVVTGVLDKNAFGKYGLVHAIQELYGNADAGRMLSSLSRLCTHYLQSHGFSCGIDDMLLVPNAEANRKALLATANDATHRSAEEFAYAGVAPVADRLRPSATVREQLESRLRERAGAEAGLDMKSTGPLNKIASATIKECLPKGQVKPFPYNYLSLMTQSGAKGGPVNFAQISALLGQQELEGRRVPRMASGKTLPCFVPFDLSARAGGFIADRFLTGIKPQEYYFHCMAGREGLVDTAVKTSRSGYLQRCLVKNLEGLRVAYDSTVRDTDKSIVQFHYGEDGLDITKVSYHTQFAFLASNAPCLRPMLEDAGEFVKRGIDSGVPKPFGPPSLPKLARYDIASTAGAVSDKFQKELDAFVEKSGKELLRRSPGAGKKEKEGKKSKKKGKEKVAAGGAGGSEKASLATEEEFRQLMALRYVAGLAAPGEAVGVIAAQSVGEPSTQMTLNTFHFAGRGEANVTLGIPRLREILMAAAKVIGTPVMTLPLRPERTNRESAEELAGRLRMIVFAELVSDVRVTERPFKLVQRGGGDAVPSRSFEVRCTVRAAGLNGGPKPKAGEATFEEVKAAFEREFLKSLLAIMKVELKRATSIEYHSIQKQKAGTDADSGAVAGGGGGAEEEDGADAEDGGAQRGGAGSKGAQQADQERDDADDSDEEDEEGAKADTRREGRSDAATTARDVDDDAAAGASSSSDEEEEDKGKEIAAAGTERRQGGAESSSDEGSERAWPAPLAKGGKGAKAAKGAKGAAGKGGKAAAVAAGGKAKEAKPTARFAAARKSGGIVSSLDMVRNSVEADDVTGTLTATVALEIGSPKLLMLDIAQRAAAAAIVRQTPRIKKCYIIEEGGWKVQTDGVNFQAAWQQADLIDTSKIGSNDIYAMLQTFGVEACRATLLNEVRSVFGAYGIAVDARHLSLIADFMTHEGAYRPCSRLGMENNPSPFQKISFETATKFLADATLRGTTDFMESPSSRLVLGRVVELGTGTTQMVYDIDRAQELQRERVMGMM